MNAQEHYSLKQAVDSLRSEVIRLNERVCAMEDAARIARQQTELTHAEISRIEKRKTLSLNK